MSRLLTVPARVAFLSFAAAAPRTSRRVAVIGGGSGGVIAARFLKRAGHRPEVFEAGTGFGGVWADKPTNDVVYKNLQTNLPTVVMQSPDLDFPKGTPSYITKPELGQYIERYAHEFGVAPITKFGAAVTSVAPLSGATGCDAGGGADGDGGGWQVEWRTSTGATQSDTYDAVVVANGHYNEPYLPEIPGEREWLAAAPDGSRAIVHSRAYNEPSEFAGKVVLVVGGRSSGVDISRQLRGVADYIYVLEKKCEAPMTHAGEAVTHVPFGTRLSSDGRLRYGGGDDGCGGVVVDGPPVDQVILATGYVYGFPFLDEEAVGMRFQGRRSVTPLYQHMQHATRPTLGFVGIQLSVPCPIPFFECQAAYLAEAWSRGEAAGEQLSSRAGREAWVAERLAAVEASGREQDLHYTNTFGASAWAYMRELIRTLHAARPPSADSDCWLERPEWEHRLETVQAVYADRGARYPQLPWHDDAYRRCEYTVDWARGTWEVDDSKAGGPPPKPVVG